MIAVRNPPIDHYPFRATLGLRPDAHLIQAHNPPRNRQVQLSSATISRDQPSAVLIRTGWSENSGRCSQDRPRRDRSRRRRCRTSVHGRRVLVLPPGTAPGTFIAICVALSRRKQGFESPRERQSSLCHLEFSLVFGVFPKPAEAVWAILFALCPSSLITASSARPT
jgi:hypothetical protein